MAKLKDLISEYGEYEVIDKIKFKTWDATLPEEKSGSIQFESREGLQIRLEPPKSKSIWDLQDGDEYYYINADGYINISTYAEIESEENSEENSVSVGNVFLIYEEAKKDVERRKVETLLLKHGGRRWFKKGESNMFLYYDARIKMLRYEIKTILPVQGTIYFDSFEKLDKAVKAIGEERVIKALFEVR